jgi:hypothetical protein
VWVPFEEKRFRGSGFHAHQTKKKARIFSFFFPRGFSVLSFHFFFFNLLPSPSLLLLLFLLRFGGGGGGGGGRFCRPWFEPSVVFSSLSSVRLLENE